VRAGEKIDVGRCLVRRAGTAASVIAACLALGAQPVLANHIPYAQGDVFAGVGGGKINHYGPTGTLKEVLDTTTGATNPPGNETGMCFDPTGKLYTTNYDAVDMSKFNSQGGLIQEPFGPDFLFPPESCVVDQPGQNLYVGTGELDSELFKLDTNGNVLAVFNPSREGGGINWIDLNPGNPCQLYYTSEGVQVKRFNVCTGTQLTDFASGLPPGSSDRGCFGLRVRSNGEVLVACDQQIVRLNTSGVIVQSYNPGSEGDFFALALDPDGQSFWAAGYTSGHIYKVNIASAAVSTNYVAAPASGAGLGGLAVYGDGAVDPGFARPRGATPVRASLVVAYTQCTSPNRTHGGPSVVSKPSCAPPVQSSNVLTVGTGDAWPGTTPGAVGSVRYDVKTTAPEDVRINASVTDVRCKTSGSVSGFCNTTNSTTPPDYSGQLRATSVLRITDRYNSAEPATQPFNDAATTSGAFFPVTVPCTTTSSTTIGSTCSILTTANTFTPGAVNDNFRTIWEFGQVQLFDGGSDGLAATSPNTLFMDEGIWIP
jgi:hypothetical protein